MKDVNRVDLLSELMEEVEYKRVDTENHYLTKDEIIVLLAWIRSMKKRLKHGSDQRI